MRYIKYNLEDQRLLASWAAKCAERVLALLENANPGDDRPSKAIEACRNRVSTGELRLAVIREAALAAHAAAREAQGHATACFAARAAGHAVATAHVAQHAAGSAYYALKAIVVSDPANAEERATRERHWQTERIPEQLRQRVMARLTIQRRGNRIVVKLEKHNDF